ncbi:hypothetical protein QE152_g8056 [Popillia japonica]|uniref:Reverse transcriptase domain-containing protein n=1 Tax=Popillia japonica TaxID=7064 RepID=A0AAW1MCZ5_POPJA
MTRKRIALPYMDDLIIPAKDEEQISTEACRISRPCNVAFLGLVIEDGRIEKSDAKTKAVLRFPELKTTKQVQSFLGLTGYFRKFIPQYSEKSRKKIGGLIIPEEKIQRGTRLETSLPLKGTQQGSGLKLRVQYLGPHQATIVKLYNSYDVLKGKRSLWPIKTTTTAEYMKRSMVSNTGSSGGGEEEPKDQDSDVDKVSGRSPPGRPSVGTISKMSRLLLKT